MIRIFSCSTLRVTISGEIVQHHCHRVGSRVEAGEKEDGNNAEKIFVGETRIAQKDRDNVVTSERLVSLLPNQSQNHATERVLVCPERPICWRRKFIEPRKCGIGGSLEHVVYHPDRGLEQRALK